MKFRFGNAASTFLLVCCLIVTGLGVAHAQSGKIVFDSQRDGNDEIYIMNADGSNQTRLTVNPTADRRPALSADGRKIAFSSILNNTDDIYTMNVDGSNVMRLTANSADNGDPAWSPDSAKITFTTRRDGGNYEIYIMNADGSNQTRLTNNAAIDQYPAFSPDGSKIVFRSLRDGNSEIYIMNADGSNQTRLTNIAATDALPTFSPDGQKIVFESDRSGKYDIWVMNADGSNPTQLTGNAADNHRPVFSPDGSKIAFDSTRDGNAEIYTMNADGSGPTRLTTNPAYDGTPSWGPSVPVLPPGIAVSPTSGLVTTEPGGTAQFSVSLTSPPTANVTIALSSSNSAEGTVTPASLTFTPSTWNTAQTVSVTGVDDAIADGDQAYTILTAPAVSADPNYNGRDADDVAVVNKDNEVAVLTLTLSFPSVLEGTILSGTVSRNTPATNSLDVNFSSANTGVVSVPATVTIPAGVSSASFTINTTDDGMALGPRTILLTASSPGLNAATASLTLNDAETPALTLRVSLSAFNEAAGSGAAIGTLTRNTTTATDLVVHLSSSNTGKAQVPLTVTIPVGASTVTFPINAIDNKVADGTQSVIIRAGSDGFADTTAKVNVTDDESPPLILSITPQRFFENAGATAARGTLYRNASSEQSLTINLSSSDLLSAEVPNFVVMPAGTNTVSFSIGTIDNDQADGPRRVTIMARAKGFAPVAAAVTVMDNEAASHFTISGHIANLATVGRTTPGIVTLTLRQDNVTLDVVNPASKGNYSFSRLPAGSYSVTATLANYAFAPAVARVTISTASAAHIDFAAIQLFSITGHVTSHGNGKTAPGVRNTLIYARSNGATFTARTNADGYYTFNLLPADNYIVRPQVAGVYFSPLARTITVNVSRPAIANVNFQLAGADHSAPTVAIATPLAVTYTPATQPRQVTGNAIDSGGSGLTAVTVRLARFANATASTPTGYLDWMSSSFTSAANPTLIDRMARGTTSWNLVGLPRLPAGFYGLRATAIDGAGNVGVSTFRRFHISERASLALSTVTASVVTNSLALRFLTPLEADSAADPTNYVVEVNGHPLTSESAAYNTSTHTVTLDLPAGALQPGDRVVTRWSHIADAQGQTASGQTESITAR